MRYNVYLLLQVAAMAASYVALTRRIDARIAGLASALLWTFVFFASFNVEHYSRCCVTTTTEPLIAVFAIGGLLVTGVFTIAAVIDELPALEETRFYNPAGGGGRGRPPRRDRRQQSSMTDTNDSDSSQQQ